MRNIGLFAMCVLSAACTTPPMFPPEIMQDVEKNAVNVKAWKEQTAHPSSADFVRHKVELGGRIIKVIRKPEGVDILVEEQPIEKYPQYGPRNLEREDTFIFAILFNGFPESGMLQVGNPLAVVGAMDRASAEVIGWSPSVLPHLRAQCLHIWNTQGVKTIDDFAYAEAMGYYPSEERTFCLEENRNKSVSTTSVQGIEKPDSDTEGEPSIKH
ncbi:MAG: Slp family lipoprotein [Nitrospira sp.]